MMLVCAHKPCSNVFQPNTHNQKYCSSECCKAATNAKIMERYYENKARRAGAKRSCFSCGATLSRYNDSRLCNKCQAAEENERNNNVLNLVLALGN